MKRLRPVPVHPPHRTGRRWSLVTVSILMLLLGPLTGVASAHVGVIAPDAKQGGYTKVTFRVPTESDSPTKKVEVAMPTDTPIASVRVQPKDGWTYQVTTATPATPISDDDGPITEIVTRVVWTATGDGIKPGEFDEFNVSAGPLPDADQVVFKVLQTYGNGDVVSWIQEPVPGAEEPDYPAPVLALAPAGDTADPTSTAVSGSVGATSGEVPAVTTVAATADTGSSSTTLAVIGLVLAVLALLTAGFAVFRGRPTGL